MRPGDAAAVRRLAERELAGVQVAESARSAIEMAIAGGSDEHRALVAEAGGDVIGVAVYGMIAGTAGTAKMHVIMVTAAARMRGVAGRMCDQIARQLASEGARLVIAEVPDIPALRPGLTLLERSGWREEARVADFFADGQALLLLRRELTEPAP